MNTRSSLELRSNLYERSIRRTFTLYEIPIYIYIKHKLVLVGNDVQYISITNFLITLPFPFNLSSTICFFSYYYNYSYHSYEKQCITNKFLTIYDYRILVLYSIIIAIMCILSEIFVGN